MSVAAPYQRGSDHLVTVAKNVRPYVDALAANPLHRVAALFQARIDVLDQEPRLGEIACRSRN